MPRSPISVRSPLGRISKLRGAQGTAVPERGGRGEGLWEREEG